jgi:O-acetyl-ADP-ribose deacetylase (regulator of RNase III)
LITSLNNNQIIVVGTNKDGLHGAGAAAQAHRDFGLEWGMGEGISGQTYALPTMEGKASFQSAINRFIRVAEAHPSTKFLLTAVGTGIADYPEAEVIEMFENATQTGWPKNVIRWEEL